MGPELVNLSLLAGEFQSSTWVNKWQTDFACEFKKLSVRPWNLSFSLVTVGMEKDRQTNSRGESVRHNKKIPWPSATMPRGNRLGFVHVADIRRDLWYDSMFYAKVRHKVDLTLIGYWCHYCCLINAWLFILHGFYDFDSVGVQILYKQWIIVYSLFDSVLWLLFSRNITQAAVQKNSLASQCLLMRLHIL